MKGLGAVLLQKGSLVVSRTLIMAETGYSKIRRELRSVVFGLYRLHYHILAAGLRYKLTISH